MKKKLLTALVILFSVLLLVQTASAESSLGQNNALNSLIKLLTIQMDWPPFNGTPGLPQGQTKVPVYLVILCWTALAAVLYVLSNNIKLFHDSPHKNAIKWFTFAFSGIAVTSSTFVNNMASLTDFTQGWLAIIGLIVIFLLILGVGFAGGRQAFGMINPPQEGGAAAATTAGGGGAPAAGGGTGGGGAGAGAGGAPAGPPAEFAQFAGNFNELLDNVNQINDLLTHHVNPNIASALLAGNAADKNAFSTAARNALAACVTHSNQAQAAANNLQTLCNAAFTAPARRAAVTPAVATIRAQTGGLRANIEHAINWLSQSLTPAGGALPAKNTRIAQAQAMCDNATGHAGNRLSIIITTAGTVIQPAVAAGP
ncbi:hypothetical protein HYY72_05605 [Candidatus Woesearchaeota archaeon]|nr:hypothetical protein [Candidatus Woesearchaeota archaeon]